MNHWFRQHTQKDRQKIPQMEIWQIEHSQVLTVTFPYCTIPHKREGDLTYFVDEATGSSYFGQEVFFVFHHPGHAFLVL